MFNILEILKNSLPDDLKDSLDNYNVKGAIFNLETVINNYMRLKTNQLSDKLVYNEEKGKYVCPHCGSDKFTVSVKGTYEAEVDTSKCLNLVEDDMNHDTSGTNDDIIYCVECGHEFSKEQNSLYE